MSLPDTGTLSPRQELIMEALAARWRLGEQVWTFGSRHVGTLNQLSNLGYVGYKSGVVQRTYLAWMTDEGRAAAMSDTYAPPGRQGIECESCMDCAQPYTVWYADNDLWNAVMGPDGPGMLCPRCFLIRAEPVSEICRVTWAETPSRRDRERADYKERNPTFAGWSEQMREHMPDLTDDQLRRAWGQMKRLSEAMREPTEPVRDHEWESVSLGSLRCWRCGLLPSGHAPLPAQPKADHHLYDQGDMVWCYRCARIECVGAVTHDEDPTGHVSYDLHNSRRATSDEAQAKREVPKHANDSSQDHDQWCWAVKGFACTCEERGFVKQAGGSSRAGEPRG